MLAMRRHALPRRMPLCHAACPCGRPQRQKFVRLARVRISESNLLSLW